MLVLQRRIGERIRIGDNIEVVVVKAARSGKVLLGIVAPRGVPVVRDDMRSGQRQRESRQRCQRIEATLRKGAILRLAAKSDVQARSVGPKDRAVEG